MSWNITCPLRSSIFLIKGNKIISEIEDGGIRKWKIEWGELWKKKIVKITFN